MRRNRKMLFLHSDIIRGRYLKQDATGGGGATPDTGAGNGATGNGNSSGTGTGESGNNNTGAGFDASTFWDGQNHPEPGSSDSGQGSASGEQDGSGTEFKDQLTQSLNSLNFGEPAMNQEMFEKLQSGDFEGFNKGINGMLNQAVRQALGLSVSVLRPFAEQIMTQVRDEISQTMSGRDDNDQLVKDFPAAADKKIRPVVQNLYAQALKNTKGDRPAAVQQVKEMMRLMSTSVADDLGLNVAPRGPDDSGRPANPAVNWLDELSARG